MAAIYGKYGIRVNAISPGGISGKVAGSEQDQNTLFKEKYINKVPLKRMARPEDISGLAVFLASDLSSYITGQSILVDGGISII